MTEYSTLAGGGITAASNAPEPFTFYKPAIDGLNAEQLGPLAFKAYEKLTIDEKLNTVAGINCNVLYEPIPFFNKAPCEMTIEGQNNTAIVLGRDRPADTLSGYGGVGHTQAGAIDIVVGRMGHKPKMFDQDDNKWFTDPDFIKDSARIYISQKTNIDENFNLTPGEVGNSKVKSGIALKADGIRLVAREGIKLITSVDKINSQGGANVAKVGVDIIAGNDSRDLQPLVKGRNLADALHRLAEDVQRLAGIVSTVVNAQITLNGALQNHSHKFYGDGMVGSPDPGLSLASPHVNSMLTKVITKDFTTLTTDLVKWRANYLSSSGDSFVNSKYNNVN